MRLPQLLPRSRRVTVPVGVTVDTFRIDLTELMLDLDPGMLDGSWLDDLPA